MAIDETQTIYVETTKDDPREIVIADREKRYKKLVEMLDFYTQDSISYAARPELKLCLDVCKFLMQEVQFRRMF